MKTALEPKIRLDNISKSFGANQVLKNISLRVPTGQVMALIGPSGSGKSTLLRCMNLLEIPDGGQVCIGDHQMDFNTNFKNPGDKILSAFRANTGMVFQHFNLFPHMSVLGNIIEAPVIVRKMSKQNAKELAMEQLAKVGLQDKAHAYPSTLSGGQKQRVAIARALAMQPEVMLFDEATSALDPELVGEVLAVIQQLAADGMTMVLVTHEMAFAREVANHVVFMRDGVVVEEGLARQVIDNPHQEATRSFLSHFHNAVATSI